MILVTESKTQLKRVHNVDYTLKYASVRPFYLSACPSACKLSICLPVRQQATMAFCLNFFYSPVYCLASCPAVARSPGSLMYLQLTACPPTAYLPACLSISVTVHGPEIPPIHVHCIYIHTVQQIRSKFSGLLAILVYLLSPCHFGRIFEAGYFDR
jgi:hypothetical protein